MLAAKNFQSGPQTLRQIEFALFDMELHANPGREADIPRRAAAGARRSRRRQALPSTACRTASATSLPVATRRATTATSGELLSADAWSAFEEEGVFNLATGARFLAEVLERGGSRDAMDNFIPSAAASRASTPYCVIKA